MADFDAVPGAASLSKAPSDEAARHDTNGSAVRVIPQQPPTVDNGTGADHDPGHQQAKTSAADSASGGGPDSHGHVAAAVQAALHVHLRDHLAKIEKMVEGTAQRAIHNSEQVLPAWRRHTQGEHRWPVALTVLAAVGLQVVVPQRLVVHPIWLLPGLELVLLALLIAANPRRINRDHRLVRLGSLTLVAVATFANVWTAAHLVSGLINGTEKEPAAQLLAYGAAIWATNVIVFALWYWEFDRGGPLARAKGTRPHPDFQFAQMQTPDLSHDHWEPAFLDYLYLSFTNATAFSPTDTLPLTRWAKMLMLAQSCVSLVTVALVVARAVNILG